jgi:hypothetical protein
MIEAVENHMPEVIVIDEIGTELEAAAARTIAERGVQLVGTAHGTTLENLMLNPTLSDLIGGIQTVTLGDEEARRRGTQKSVLERKAPPTFDVMVEILDRDRVAVHQDVAEVVDSILRGAPLAPEIRERHNDGRISSRPGQFEASRDTTAYTPAPGRGGYDQSYTRGRGGRRRGGGGGGGSYQAGGGGQGGYDRMGGGRGGGGMTSMAALSPGPSRLTSRAAPVSDYYGERSERQAATARYTVYDEDHGDDDETGPVALAPVSVAVSPIPRAPGLPGSSTKPLRIYPFGVSRNRLERPSAG